MVAPAPALLPYRTDASDLIEWVAAQARGAIPARVRKGHGSSKAREGVSLTAALLGFTAGGEPTPRGSELALADEPRRGGVIREALLSFPPYGDLLRELRGRRQSRVEAEWVEAWWATHGYGGSQSNRREGVAVLGRLAEHAGLARYIQGRRGFPTRIEWDLSAVEAAAGPAPLASAAVAEPAGAAGEASAEPRDPTRPQRIPEVSTGEVNRVRIALEGGRTARLDVPMRLSPPEKRRLLELLDLLIADG